MTGSHRGLIALVLAGSMLVLAGCSNPPGTDGNLANGWPAQPVASFSVPEAGSCLSGAQVSAFEPVVATLRAVDCSVAHTVEVVAGGRLADSAAPPDWDSDPTRAAYAECDKAATAYAGADWRTGRLFPILSFPKPPAWQGGARQWTCGLAEAADDLFAPLARTGSVRGGLLGDRPLALACVLLGGTNVTPDGFYKTVNTIKPLGCSEPHDTEFVGAYGAPAGPYPSQQQLDDLVGNACYAKIAAFLGITQNQLYARGDVYTFWTGLTAKQWKLGDRTAHCFLNVSSKTPMHATVRDLGTKPLP